MGMDENSRERRGITSSERTRLASLDLIDIDVLDGRTPRLQRPLVVLFPSSNPTLSDPRLSLPFLLLHLLFAPAPAPAPALAAAALARCVCLEPALPTHAKAAMASLAAVAGAATLASPAAMVSFSGLRPLRVSKVSACPRVHLISRHARCLPRIQAAAQEATFLAVKDIIAEQLACEPTKITPDAKFADLGADSLDTVEIMMALEEKFDIQLDQEAGEKISTVGDAADLIQDVIESASK